MNNSVKITSIVENKSKCNNLLSEHGLSFLIESDNKSILFDTGASDLIIKNAMNLNINLDKIDYIALSHGHYDHTSGLEHIKNKKVLTHPDIFIPKYHKKDNRYTYSGISHNKEHYEMVNKIEFIEVQNSIKLTSHINLHVNFKNKELNSFYTKSGNDYIHDLFTDELALSINTHNGLIIVTGCAHSGIINIIEKVIEDTKTETIYALLGGFHLKHLTPKETEQIAEKINSYHINMLGISHCTGDKLGNYLNTSKVFNFNTGDQFTC